MNREDDIRIAEQVLGLKVKIQETGLDTGLWMEIHPTYGANPLPFYSISIRASFKILDKAYDWSLWKEPDGTYTAEIIMVNGDEVSSANADTVPKAICLAALKGVK